MDEPLVRAFPMTRHSAVEAARSSDAAERERGLETIALAYWRPVYGYLRLHWHKRHDEAADLTQEFFADLVENDLLGRFDASRARLRTWMRVCIDGLVQNEARAAARQKRGGGAAEFDFEAARAAIEATPSSDSPEAQFERDWARAVFALALRRLRERSRREGKAQHVELLEEYDLGERTSYAEMAKRHGIAVTDVTNRLAWARRELRGVVLEVLRELTCSEAEFRDEARALLGIP
jgi:RNA polymerase sigma factor (sigma-70 family)